VLAQHGQNDGNEAAVEVPKNYRKEVTLEKPALRSTRCSDHCPNVV
jgi:hypothetical protein